MAYAYAAVVVHEIQGMPFAGAYAIGDADKFAVVIEAANFPTQAVNIQRAQIDCLVDLDQQPSFGRST